MQDNKTLSTGIYQSTHHTASLQGQHQLVKNFALPELPADLQEVCSLQQNSLPSQNKQLYH
jgi:hypothetical protein